MKIIMIVIAFLALCIAVIFACPKGSFEYNGGCEYDIQPEIAKAVKPSDEKPPSDKMPSYQREGVHVVDAPNMAFEDAKADREKMEAEEQGRKAAGIK